MSMCRMDVSRKWMEDLPLGSQVGLLSKQDNRPRSKQASVIEI